MTDDDTLPLRLARLQRLKKKHERGGSLTDDEIEQIHEDTRALNESIEAAFQPLAETVVDIQRSMVDALQPLAEVMAEYNADVEEDTDE